MLASLFIGIVGNLSGTHREFFGDCRGTDRLRGLIPANNFGEFTYVLNNHYLCTVFQKELVEDTLDLRSSFDVLGANIVSI